MRVHVHAAPQDKDKALLKHHHGRGLVNGAGELLAGGEGEGEVEGPAKDGDGGDAATGKGKAHCCGGAAAASAAGGGACGCGGGDKHGAEDKGHRRMLTESDVAVSEWMSG